MWGLKFQMSRSHVHESVFSKCVNIYDILSHSRNDELYIDDFLLDLHKSVVIIVSSEHIIVIFLEVRS